MGMLLSISVYSSKPVWLLQQQLKYSSPPHIFSYFVGFHSAKER
jgi:hypothetical protein